MPGASLMCLGHPITHPILLVHQPRWFGSKYTPGAQIHAPPALCKLLPHNACSRRTMHVPSCNPISAYIDIFVRLIVCFCSSWLRTITITKAVVMTVTVIARACLQVALLWNTLRWSFAYLLLFNNKIILQIFSNTYHQGW